MKIHARRLKLMSRRVSLAVVVPLLLVSFAAPTRAEPPVEAQTLETLKAAYTFQPNKPTQESPFLLPQENRDENIIQLEKMIVMDSPATRGLIESVDKQQAILKQTRFDWETGGFYYRKVGRKFTVEAGVWSHGPTLTLLTVSW
jgi:hypothetical protein